MLILGQVRLSKLALPCRVRKGIGIGLKPPKGAKNKREKKFFSIILDPAFYHRVHLIQRMYICKAIQYLSITHTSFRLSLCLTVCLSACLSVRLSVCPSACLFVRLSVRLSACLSVRLYVCPTVCLSNCLSVRLSVCPPVCLSACLSVCQSAT